MCGITGKFYFDQSENVDRHTLAAMTSVIAHRGPDDHGFYRDGNIGLGFRRLSILDLSPAGHQPMSNEDGSVHVIFNGEIYNYKSLRKDLQSRGHVFRSKSDTEVIVHAYEEFGIDCVKSFDGMFAFAIWDSRRRRLVLARDHFGIKPLYYFASDHFISFASEIKSILQDPEVPRAVDLQAVSNFLSLHYVPAPRTMFKGICKLLPGHILIAENRNIGIHKFWELQSEPRGAVISESEAADRIYSELKESVRERLQSDVPVGALLSGGLDSSAIVGLMTEVSGRSVPAFSVGYSEDGMDGFSEFQYARRVARHLDSQYHEVVVTPQMFLDFLPEAIWFQDEPIGEPASIPLYYVCKLAKDNGITVLLSGEGSDELFAGYNRHLGEMASTYYGRLPNPVHKSLEWMLSALPRVPIVRKGHRAMSVRDPWERYKSWHTVFSSEMKQALFAASEALLPSFEDSFSRFASSGLPKDSLHNLLFLDLKVWLPDDLLMKKDRMGMATSLEARVPFLDHKFAELAFNLPSHLKIKGLTGKYILKKSMQRLLPKEIIYRKKAGFPTPISKWMAEELRAPITEMLCEGAAGDHGLFDRSIVRRLLGEHISGRENHERLIFPLLNFELWYRRFFASEVCRAPEDSLVALA